jgi:hypothetical protein
VGRYGFVEMSDEHDTEQLRAVQQDRAAAERRRAAQAEDEEEAAAHERRADKAEYLREKLEERADSEQERSG